MNTSKDRADKLISLKQSCDCKNILLKDANEKLYKLDNTCKVELTTDDRKVIKLIVDLSLSSKSENPVLNKAIKAALDLKQDKIPDLDLIIKGALLGITAILEENDPTIPDYIKNITEEDIERWNRNSPSPSPEVTSEIDPIFINSPAGSITEQDISNWNSKQDPIQDLDAIRSSIQTVNSFNLRVLSLESSIGNKPNSSDLATVAFSGSYNDLINKPEGPQFNLVNADWNSTSGPSLILNKPTFKTVGGYSIIGTGDIPVGTGTGGPITILEVTTMGKGTLESARDKVRLVGSNTLFLWILDLPQEEGPNIHKMIWHIGGGVFMDALGYMLTSN